MYRTYDYRCLTCGWHDVQLHTKGEHPPSVTCESCSGSAVYVLGAPTVMNVALPDGTKRFTDLKIQHQLKQAAAQAKAERNFSEEKRLKSELKKASKQE